MGLLCFLFFSHFLMAAHTFVISLQSNKQQKSQSNTFVSWQSLEALLVSSKQTRAAKHSLYPNPFDRNGHC